LDEPKSVESKVLQKPTSARRRRESPSDLEGPVVQKKPMNYPK
jgi:hypothetical protein